LAEIGKGGVGMDDSLYLLVPRSHF